LKFLSNTCDNENQIIRKSEKNYAVLDSLHAYLTCQNHEKFTWSWSYGNWICHYLCKQCLSSLMLWVWTPFMVRCTQYNIMW